MIGKNTEKAIKAWLALPKERRFGELAEDLVLLSESGGGGSFSPMARFTIASIVAKRYPKRKKTKKERDT